MASLHTPNALTQELESAVATEVAQKSYIIDTSVLLSDPKAPLRFAEHEVIIPIVVISELEKKRHDAELGYYARSALRLLDSLRVRHGTLNRPVPSMTRRTPAGRTQPHHRKRPARWLPAR